MSEEKIVCLSIEECRRKRLELEDALSFSSLTPDQKIVNINKQQELLNQESLFRGQERDQKVLNRRQEALNRQKDHQKYDDAMELAGGRRPYGTGRSVECDKLLGGPEERMRARERLRSKPVVLDTGEAWDEDDGGSEFNEEDFADLDDDD